MPKQIFTRTSLKRRDLFERFIKVMLDGGWQLMNANTANRYIMKSTGSTGDKNIILEILPYDGSSYLNNYTYDMRNKDRSQIASNALFRMMKSYDPTTDTGVYETTNYYLIPFYGSRSADTSSSLQWTYADYDLDMYFYADKDRVMFFLNHWRYTGYPNHFFMMGLPEESYLQEDFTGFPTNWVWYSHCTMPAQNSIWVKERPKNFYPKNGVPYDLPYAAIFSPLSPNYDNRYPMSEIIYFKENEGLRFRLGGFYIVRPNDNRILDGDLIKVTAPDGTIEKYRYCIVPLYNNRAAPLAGIAIRIQ